MGKSFGRKCWAVTVSIVLAAGLAACLSDSQDVTPASTAPRAVEQTAARPAATTPAHENPANWPAPPVPPVFARGTERIGMEPLRVRFDMFDKGVRSPNSTVADDGLFAFHSVYGGARLSGMLVASNCVKAGTNESYARGKIVYELNGGEYSSNGLQRCIQTLAGTPVSQLYSWRSTTSWSGGRLVLSGQATVVETSARSPDEPTHYQYEEQATLRISGERCTVESYRRIERKSQPKSRFFSDLTSNSSYERIGRTACSMY